VEKKHKKIIIGIMAVVAVLFLFLTIFRISHSKIFKTETVDTVKKSSVSVVAARMETIRNTLFYTGDIHAKNEATLYTLVTGRIAKYNFHDGDRVNDGDVVVVLERIENWDEFMPVLVKSPISGTLAFTYLNAGELATPQTPLALIVGGGGSVVSILVPDTELVLIKRGMEAELRVPTNPDSVFSGTVTNVSTAVEKITRTARVEIACDDRGGNLLSGMFGDVTIILEKKDNALVIPSESLLYDGEGKTLPYCFVVSSEIAHKAPLTLGIVEKGKVEVTSGLNAGDNVVTLGKENLKEDSPVTIIKSK